MRSDSILQQGTITLVLGGVRSGKSRFAQDLAARVGGDQVLFVATAETRDDEMIERVEHHRQSRPESWETLERPLGTGMAITDQRVIPRVVLVDCLTLLVSNVLCAEALHSKALPDQLKSVESEVDALIAVASERHVHLIIVSGEVGLGVVPEHALEEAYADYPLPLGHGATISQPTVVGMMSEALDLDGTQRILEVGTGSGYQAAVLSRLAFHVDTIEVIPELADRARRALAEIGCTNVDVHVGDGWEGVPARAPYDRIVVTAAPDRVPEALVDQLVEGGLLVVPVGPQTCDQRLERHIKTEGRMVREDLGAVRFVPMVHALSSPRGSS